MIINRHYFRTLLELEVETLHKHANHIDELAACHSTLNGMGVIQQNNNE
jgi:hypothetical protein